MNNTIVIIGGGVAGLCAAIELCRIGLNPILIESGTYPSHKVCGEFLSPESIAWLEELDIHPTKIDEIHLDFNLEKKAFSLPMSAGSLSHYILDASLAEKARAMGTEVLTHVKVIDFQPKCQVSDLHLIELSTGEKLQAHSVIFAAGRLPTLTIPPKHFQYIGIKAHFEGIPIGNTLKMFGFNGAYLGLSPIEEGKANLACLASMERFKCAASAESFMEELINSNSNLKNLLSNGRNLFSTWMTAQIPFFGFKSIPNWIDAYFIGDSAISIPPACGEGLSLAIRTGIDAVQHASKKDYKGFRESFRQKNASKMRIAKGLHYLFMRPRLGKNGLKLCSLWPSLPQKLFMATRN